MFKIFAGIFIAVLAVTISSQNYPYFAYNQGYIMQDGIQAQYQNIASMASFWGAKRGKITDTCPQTLTSARWGADSLSCIMISNFSGTNILLKFLGNNNRTDTVPVIVPAGDLTIKLPRVWKIVSTSVTSSTMDSLVFWFQNIKKLPGEY
ncbi:MAG TPA: hypothetical protein VIJ25_08285 [Methylococcales bacterium]